MALVAIKTNRRAQEERRFFYNGMKPFFLLAALQSVISMVWWTAIYTFHWIPSHLAVSPFHWHGHEFVYGFTLAVIAGFLLAALPEWTNIQTVSGRKLGGLALLWSIPRILFLWGTSFLEIAALFDLLFSLALLVAVAHPIVISQRWRQSGILAKVALLGVGNLCFYLGALQWFPNGLHLSLYGGVYLIVSLILTVGGRVLPGFIQNALDLDTPLANPRWITAATMALFVPFFMLELSSPHTQIARSLAIALGALLCIRLYRWHVWGIWSRPLLLGLYLSFMSIALGFFLVGTTSLTGASQSIALHAFTVGGIGMATLSMMIRAALGHSGGDVRNPPKLTSMALIALGIAEICRILLPLLYPNRYAFCIAVSQVAWTIAYLLLSIIIIRIFWQARA